MSRRVAALQFACPTCHAPAGAACLRSAGRRGRRRAPDRRAMHFARVELATNLIEEGRSPGLRRLADPGRSASVPQSALAPHTAAA
jgi:hypothetical protein